MANPSSNYECAVEIREELRGIDNSLNQLFPDLVQQLMALSTRRDLFAAMALQTLIKEIGLYPPTGTPAAFDKMQYICARAWMIADVMLASDPMPKTPSPENK